jgi:hypothetical protein
VVKIAEKPFNIGVLTLIALPTGKKLVEGEPRRLLDVWPKPCPRVDQTLLVACMSGDLSTTKHISSTYPKSLLEKDAEGMNCLHIAICQGHIGIVDLLLDMRRNDLVKHTDSRGYGVIHYAARCRALRIVKRLVEEFNINPDDAPGQNRVIHLAALSGSLELVRYLVEEMPENQEMFRASVMDLNGDGTEVEVAGSAVLADNLEIFIYCLEKHPEPFEYWSHDIYELVVTSGASRIWSYLQEQDLIPGSFESQAVPILAASNGCIELLEALQNSGYDLLRGSEQDDADMTPLKAAASAGKFEVVRWLLRNVPTVDIASVRDLCPDLS